METSLTARAEFSAGVSRSNGQPSHPHGHSYFVEATARTGLAPDWKLPSDLRVLSNELDERALEDMMRGGSVDLDGVARWFMERLLTNHPNVVSVMVTEGGRLGMLSCTATRELRTPPR